MSISIKKTIRVEIVSAEEQVFSGSALMVVACGIEGDIGICAQHAPLLTQLEAGPVRVILSDSSQEVIYVSGGLLEVQPDVVTVLADTVVRAADLQEAEVLALKAEAEKELSGHSQQEWGAARAELARAVGMLRTFKQLKRSVSGHKAG